MPREVFLVAEVLPDTQALVTSMASSTRTCAALTGRIPGRS